MNISKNNFIIVGLVIVALFAFVFHVFANTGGDLPHAPLVQRHSIFGDVVSVTQDSVTIDPTDGPAGINPSSDAVTIQVDPSALISGNTNGEPIQSLADVTTGDMVQISEDENGNAIRVAVLPAPVALPSLNTK